MPTNQTENYQLSQWERTDQVQMEDFNADNAKLDAALKAEADARAALETTKGNCRIWTTRYTGTGQYGESHPNRIDFPWTPNVVLVFGDNGFLLTMHYGVGGGMVHAGAPGWVTVTWTEQSVCWDANGDTVQMNRLGSVYRVVIFGAM